LVSGGASIRSHSLSCRQLRAPTLVLACLAAPCCGSAPASPDTARRQPQTQAACLAGASFPDPATSPYCLPWAEGDSHGVGQGYCSTPPASHHLRYAYDFLMPLGTEIRNVREGVVVELREHFADDDRIGGHENMLSLRHDDETISIYMHLQHLGVAVEMGQRVPRGALLGWSGATGDPAGIPHLHFQICIRGGLCSYTTQEITLPVSFRNAQGTLNPAGGLEVGRTYTAGACR
jgi:hypothetical protein